MAAEKKAPETPAVEGEGDQPPKKKSKLLLIIVLIVLSLLVVAGGGGAAYFFLLRGKSTLAVAESTGEQNAEGSAAKQDEAANGTAKAKREAAKAQEASKPADPLTPGPGPLFVPIPTVVVNLKDAAKTRFLRVTVVIEVASASGEKAAKAQIPKIIDAIQLFLRTQQTEAFSSVASLVAIKSEIMHRVNGLDAAIEARSVLIQELMIQ